jgi:hypothetical protein
MNNPHPREVVAAGASILLEVLGPRGFTFVAGHEGNGSGGRFAQGALVNNTRILGFSFRHGLGEVNYQIDGRSISHENYLKYSGNWKRRRYPDYGSSPEASFAALAQDIEEFLKDFSEGRGEVFLKVVADFEANPNRFSGFSALNR